MRFVNDSSADGASSSKKLNAHTELYTTNGFMTAVKGVQRSCIIWTRVTEINFWDWFS